MKKKSKDFLDEMSIEEDEYILVNNKEKEKQELNDLINQSSMNLSICLMKICQENNYKPLSIENYYENVISKMDNMKKTNGLKYKSKSINAVRSAIVSNNLFIKNKNHKNLYSLNIKECIKYLKTIKKENKTIINSNNLNDSVINNENNNELLGKKRKDSYDCSNNQIKRYKHLYNYYIY